MTPTISRLYRASATLALSALSFAGLLALPAGAQTPTSNIYAFTELHSRASSVFGSGSKSKATAIANGAIVGYGSGSATGNRDNAVLWKTDGSIVDLQSHANAQLGANSGTTATGIIAYADGTGYNVVGSGYGDYNGQPYVGTGGRINALEWSTPDNYASANKHRLLEPYQPGVSGINLGTGSQSTITGVSTYTIPATGATGQNSVGYASGSTSGGLDRAIRFNTDNTVTNLHTTSLVLAVGDDAYSAANAIDGFTAVGYASGSFYNGQRQAVLWDANGGISLIGQFANVGVLGANGYSVATGISGDAIVGYGTGANLGYNINALRWYPNGSVSNLHDQLAASGIDFGANSSSYATGIANGITVGYASPALEFEGSAPVPSAIRWNDDGSALDLQQFVTGGATISQANAIDPLTGVIVGSAGDKACLWTPLGGGTPLIVTIGAVTTINQNYTQTTGSTVVNGTLAVTNDGVPGTFTLTGGTLGGSGTIDGNVLNNGGTVAPGNSPGNLSINGDYTQNAGTLFMEIAGVGAGQFDRVSATGAATLGGALDIASFGGFDFGTLPPGQTFDILSAGGGISGTFASVTSGWNFGTVNSGTTGRLTYLGVVTVPEANTGLLALLAVPAIVVLRRRSARA